LNKTISYIEGVKKVVFLKKKKIRKLKRDDMKFEILLLFKKETCYLKKF